jgi:hypothetical protein
MQISCPGKPYTSAFTVERFSHIKDLLTVKNFTTDPQLIIILVLRKEKKYPLATL